MSTGSDPCRVQRQRTRGWRAPEGAVYVGRGTDWGNPFKVGETVSINSALWPYLARTVPGGACSMTSLTPLARQSVVDAFAWWFFEQPHLMLTVVEELGGKDLMCWCPLTDADGASVPCHAEVLLEMANPELHPFE